MPVTAWRVSWTRDPCGCGHTSTNDHSKQDFWYESNPSRTRSIDKSRLDRPDKDQETQRGKGERHGSFVGVINMVDDKK